jgi:hypothetical protein
VRRLAIAATGFVLALATLPLLPSVGRAADNDALSGVLSAEVEAFAFRVEYDIPLPAGPGSLARVAGEIRRSQAGENSKGIAAAPTQFDAVVGGTYADPDKNRKGDERNVPQVECFFPGHLLDTRFAFPTNTQAETAGLPATSVATARCGAGPEVELHSTDADLEAPAVATMRGVASDALGRPTHGALEATAATRADGISILDGAITVGSIDLSGRSRITGKRGDGLTSSRVVLNDVTAGGVTFSVADDQIVTGDQVIPVGSTAGQSFFDSVNAGLSPTGCRLAANANPNRYPQGFLFGRPEPRVGTDPDGTFAASFRAGLFVLCDLPAAITDNAKVGNQVFSPQRAQMVLGFVYTSTSATTEPGGFGLGDLALPSVGPVVSGDAIAAPAPVVPDLSAAAPVAAPPAQRGAAAASTRPAPFLHFGPMDSTTRWLLAIVAFVVWAALTHLGVRRLRGVFGD